MRTAALVLGVLVLGACGDPSADQNERTGYQAGGDDTQQLAPFTSDGCSQYFEGTCERPFGWLRCCVVHDLAYWRGGTSEERDSADRGLKECVSSSGFGAYAGSIYAGVRAFGGPQFNLSFSWGYGWRGGRGYKALSPSEEEQVRALQPDDAGLRQVEDALIQEHQNDPNKNHCQPEPDPSQGA